MDKKDLNYIIDFLSKYFQYSSISVWGVDRKCIFATDSYKKYLNMETVVGKTQSEFNDYLNLHDDEFYNEVTAKVLHNKMPVMAYYIYPNKGTQDFGIYSITVTPVLNNDKNVIAVISHGALIENSSVFEVLFNKVINNNTHQAKQSLYSSLKFTRRERIIIFLLICGKGHKEISLVLSRIYKRQVLPNSVSSIISKQIYPKFDVYNNSDLLMLALRSGILYNIPQELVNNAPMILYTLENPNYETMANRVPWLD